MRSDAHIRMRRDAHIRIHANISRMYARIFAVGAFPAPAWLALVLMDTLTTEANAIECPKTLQLKALHQKY